MADDDWQVKANLERSRLFAALGEITAGGVVADIQHIGATSVRGLPTQPCVDLALAVTPFPVDVDQLALLGYVLTPDSNGFEQHARHMSGRFELFICEQGSEEWTHQLLVRDYLRHSADARTYYAAHKAAATADATLKNALFSEVLLGAQRWWPTHVGFAPVDFVAQELRDLDCPWYISSGWALDLFLGRVTRVHHDVDVVVARADQLALREHMTARNWSFVTPLQGKLEPWPPHMRLELPRHQAHAHRAGEFIDFLLTDFTHETWHYRRNPIIIRRREQVGRRTSGGIPYLAPELLLLYKSKNTGTRARSQDQVDYENALPHLSAEARSWLRWALIATAPDHPWINQLI